VGFAGFASLRGFEDGLADVMPTFDVVVTMELLPIPDFIPEGAAKFPWLAVAGDELSEILVSSSMNDANTKGFISVSAYSWTKPFSASISQARCSTAAASLSWPPSNS